MSTLLETVDLVTNFYTYEGVVKALNRVSLVVDHGATFGLVGESGCGKSVTVRSIMRIVQEPGAIEGGKVIVFLDSGSEQTGIDLLMESETYMESLRGDRISMIFQEPNAALNPTLSIGVQVSESFLFHQRKEMSAKILTELESPECRTFFPLKKIEQILYSMAAREPDTLTLKSLSRVPFLRRWQKRMKREAKKRSIAIVGNLGIPNPEQVVEQFPHNLSGGMKQRIVIAMALACSPVLLIADEATSNLDVTIQAQIIELLRRLKEDVISSILLITHDLGVVAETCDRVGVMYAGNLCEVADVKGNVPNLVNPPAGCRFHPRCPHVMEICTEAFPELLDVGDNHLVACYLIRAGGR
jgi:peptide/nickel transport system ATP-binding protein